MEREHGVLLAPIRDPSVAKSPGSLAVFYEALHRILGKYTREGQTGCEL